VARKASDVLIILGLLATVSGVALYDWRLAVVLGGVSLVGLGIVFGARV